ncbi:MAG: flagellar biosynthesis protein FliQ [Oscillospiraceae bacterium]|nr:flagellar biosynthesis protein FliQ [Oscillospiraceae bacterium]
MDTGFITDIMMESFLTALMLALPPLLVSLAVGLIISILQAATQVSEQTLTFVPKLLAIGITLVLLGPWMLEVLSDYTVRLFDTVSRYA